MSSLRVLDTNILLNDSNNIFSLAADGSTIVLPETVLDELDSKKSGFDEINYQARQLGRLLATAERLETVHIRSLLTISKLQLNSVQIWIVSAQEYPDYSSTAANIVNDNKIIHVADLLSKHYPVEFITVDVMCRIRAEALGLPTGGLDNTEEQTLEFQKTLELPPEQFSTVDKMPVSEVDPDYKPENFNYMFKCDEIGQTKLATIRNGSVSVIGKVTEKDLRNQSVRPQNSGQLFLAKAIQDPLVNIVVAEAAAGTGKTLSAISNAMRLVDLGKYSSIIYIRASVDDLPKEEQIGFLPGNAEKLEPYLHPLDDSLDFIVRSKSKASRLTGEEYETFVQESIAALRTKYNIQPMIGLGMRGRTFAGAIIIIDEVQNQSKSSLQKMITRVGKDSKVILCGSNNQIDNPFETKHTNGLSVVLNACTKETDIRIHAVPLTKIVRSPISEWAEDIFSVK